LKPYKATGEVRTERGERRVLTVEQRCTRIVSLPATPLSHVPIGPKTGGFASPPYDGFALTLRGQLIPKRTRWQSVRTSARRQIATSKQRYPPRARMHTRAAECFPSLEIQRNRDSQSACGSDRRTGAKAVRAQLRLHHMMSHGTIAAASMSLATIVPRHFSDRYGAGVDWDGKITR
jgi:hypothetical protein